ncbi:MAG: DUF3536 domain-containing protein, partial [Candidatus Korobacteraceae bacterium]
PGWNQAWRAPLRAAFDYLRDELSPEYERKASELLHDPWQARDEYINVVLDRDEASLRTFFAKHAKAELTDADTVTALALLEMQRHAMLMYTSCGWFFDELSGIETVQTIMYAGRALQLAQMLFPDHREEKFKELLALAKSNLAEDGDGARIFEKWVEPAEVNLLAVAAHYAIASMFERMGESNSINCYEVRQREDIRLESGRARLAMGTAQIRSRITHEQQEVSFGVLHFGDHNVTAGVRGFRGEQEFKSAARELRESFQSADLPAVLRLLDKHFNGATYSLRSLFRDERQKVVSKILGSTMDEAEAAYRQIYEHHAPLMGFLSDMGAPLPKMLHLTAEFVLNTALRKEFLADEIDLERIQTLLDTAAREKIQWDEAWLGYALKRRLSRMADELAVNPREERLQRFNAAVGLVRSLPFEVNLAPVQNVFYQLLQNVYPTVALEIDEASQRWASEFAGLGEKLGVCVEPVPIPTA